MPTTPSRLRRSAPVVGLLLGITAASAAIIQTSTAAFESSTENTGNSFATGSVTLTDDDGGSAMFNLSNMVAGDTATECIEVTYTGTLTPPEAVQLYGALPTSEGDLADNLNLVIEQGTSLSDPADCSSTLASGSAVFNTGSLSAFVTSHNDYASGVDTFTPAPAPGSNSRVFRFTVTLNENAPETSQGVTVVADFTWEVHSA